MAMGVLCLALPFAYTPNLLFGLGDQIRASSYPASWQTVARLVRESAPVLFLPWHEYQAFPFTTNRVVNTPAEQYFPAPILESQDAGPGYQSGPVDPEVSFVSSIVKHEGLVANAGALLSAIGVRWIILAKVNDWRSYGWLLHQHDLRSVFNVADVEVFVNTTRPLVPARVTTLRSTTTVQALLTSNSGDAVGAVIASYAKRVGLNTTREPAPATAVSFHQSSPVSAFVGPSGPGWFVLPIPYEPGWSLNGRQGVRLATGKLAVPATDGGELHFNDWPPIFVSELGSLFAVLIGIGASLQSRRRTISAGPNRTQALHQIGR